MTNTFTYKGHEVTIIERALDRFEIRFKGQNGYEEGWSALNAAGKAKRMIDETLLHPDYPENVNLP